MQVQRREVESHLQSAMRMHLDLACVKLHNTEIQLNNIQEELRETTRKLEQKINSSQEDLRETTRKLDEKFNDLDNTRLMQCPDVHTWKITGFSEALRQAKTGEEEEMESVPFYNCGYKFKISLNPNGHGSGKNTHLSIFFHLMKGEYDAILPWPFNKKVTFMLIDQQEDPNERKNVVMTLTTDPKQMHCWMRPETDISNGRGFNLIPHYKLKERRYIVDDTLFIQVKIATP